jgi:hypothetical protein
MTGEDVLARARAAAKRDSKMPTLRLRFPAIEPAESHTVCWQEYESISHGMNTLDAELKRQIRVCSLRVRARMGQNDHEPATVEVRCVCDRRVCRRASMRGADASAHDCRYSSRDDASPPAHPRWPGHSR